ncbi:MAG: sigma-70 family RNA polymerase sigma factor [Myxococcota bacterium]
MSDAPDETAADAARSFEPHRAHVLGVAYRMLGSVAEAEDVVQDCYLRWLDADRAEVRDARAFLTTSASRLALDRLASARARREVYVGPWLPEPLVLDQTATPEAAAELAQDLSVALLMTLERLSPLERAAFLLHDVFDQDFAAVAATLGRSEDACRQLAARARAHVRESRVAPPPEEASRGQRLADAFRAASVDGDIAALGAFLAEDAVLYSDGGGKRRAALNPIFGRDRILRFIAGVMRKRAAPTLDSIHAVTINGAPGLIVRDDSGDLETVTLDIVGERIVAIYLVRNPDKLRHITWPS